ncbi:MAG: hypothetical protein ACXAD7_03980 [Candidatus Kariarchaeaceae archaeon]
MSDPSENQVSKPTINIIMIILLSILPYAGHSYLQGILRRRNTLKVYAFFLGTIILYFVFYIGAILHVYLIYDAYKIATSINEGQEVQSYVL